MVVLPDEYSDSNFIQDYVLLFPKTGEVVAPRLDYLKVFNPIFGVARTLPEGPIPYTG